METFVMCGSKHVSESPVSVMGLPTPVMAVVEPSTKRLAVLLKTASRHCRDGAGFSITVMVTVEPAGMEHVIPVLAMLPVFVQLAVPVTTGVAAVTPESVMTTLRVMPSLAAVGFVTRMVQEGVAVVGVSTAVFVMVGGAHFVVSGGTVMSVFV